MSALPTWMEVVGVNLSNSPPRVSTIGMSFNDEMPGTKRSDCSVYQRWLAAPGMLCPFCANVYHAANTRFSDGEKSNISPCPPAAGSNQLPEKPYVPVLACTSSPDGVQLTFGVRRTSG